MRNDELELLEQVLNYLQLHNRVMYEKLSVLFKKYKEQKAKDNARKLAYITEKRKTNKEYGGHGKDRYKKEVLK